MRTPWSWASTRLAFERLYMGNPRGPIFKIANPEMLALREKLGRGRLKNIFVTNSANVQLSDFRVFDGELVDSLRGNDHSRGRLDFARKNIRQVTIIEAGEWPRVDLNLMVQKFREELGIRYLLCEGGPTFYGSMTKAGLIDEKFVTIAPVEVGQAAPPEQEMAEFDKTRIRPNDLQWLGVYKRNDDAMDVAELSADRGLRVQSLSEDESRAG